MGLFGKKKEEAKKELNDIKQIKESISTSEKSAMPEPMPTFENPETSSATEQWMKEFGGGARGVPEKTQLPQNQKDWSGPVSVSIPGQIPRVETFQTPNVSKLSSSPTVSALSQKSDMEGIPESAPLFIKLDRYKNILHTISDLRNTVTKVKNAFEMFSEMERVKAENLRVIEAAVQKVEARIVDLDTEFIKPVGYTRPQEENEQMEEGWESAAQPEKRSDDNLHVMIEDLRGQIEKLKEELNQMSPEDKRLIEEFDK